MRVAVTTEGTIPTVPSERDDQDNGWTAAELVERGRVASRVFTGAEIFARELTQIFERSWIYLAHASEIDSPGDYCVRPIGRQSVIVSRTADGRITAMMNRCRHRGSTVCQRDRGSATFFRCQYHGWTYANDGRLVGVPYPSSYGPEFSKDDLGLSVVPKLDSYRGFIFGSLSPNVGPLLEWLGPTTEIIDDFLRASPVEEIEVCDEVQKCRFRGNWKYVGMDGYHTNFTHRSLLEMSKSASGGNEGRGSMNTDESPNRSWSFGNGHVRLDFSPSLDGRYDDILRDEEQKRMDPTAYGEYLESMQRKYGDQLSRVLGLARDPHLQIWPSMQLIGVHIRTIHPLAPDLTEVRLYVTRVVGAGEAINEARISAHERFYGPAGFGQPDDCEMFERNQVGLQCELNPWLNLERGLETEVAEQRGRRGGITDETPQRGQMAAWRAAMEAEL